jgi:hypothetical protein
MTGGADRAPPVSHARTLGNRADARHPRCGSFRRAGLSNATRALAIYQMIVRVLTEAHQQIIESHQNML